MRPGCHAGGSPVELSRDKNGGCLGHLLWQNLQRSLPLAGGFEGSKCHKLVQNAGGIDGWTSGKDSGPGCVGAGVVAVRQTQAGCLFGNHLRTRPSVLQEDAGRRKRRETLFPPRLERGRATFV